MKTEKKTRAAGKSISRGYHFQHERWQSHEKVQENPLRPRHYPRPHRPVQRDRVRGRDRRRSRRYRGDWADASGQIKQVVNNVVFPVIDLILAVFFFAKLGMAYFDYKKHGQFEWTAPAILFACLVFTLTAPLYVWTIIGI